MKVTLLLADAAQAVGGKLYIMGGGWSVTGPGPVPSALAIKIEVPWTEANRTHNFTLELLDEDGQPVQPEGQDQPVRADGQFEVGRPPGLPEGTPIDVPLALNVPPVQLVPGGRYTWRLQIDGESQPDWHAAFLVRAASPAGFVQQ